MFKMLASKNNFLMGILLLSIGVFSSLSIATVNQVVTSQNNPIDFSVSDDDGDGGGCLPGVGGDAPSCTSGDTQCFGDTRYACVAYAFGSNGCNYCNGCRGYQQYVNNNSCVTTPPPPTNPPPTNPPPAGNNPTQCSGSAPTASVCRNAAAGTYVAAADCTCTFNGGAGSNLCGCIPNNTPVVEPDPEPEPETPTSNNNGDQLDPGETGSSYVPLVCGRNLTDKSGGVCDGLSPGTNTSSNCYCTNSCTCIGTRTGGQGDSCLGDQSCGGGLTCQKLSSKGYTCEKSPAQVAVENNEAVNQVNQDLVDTLDQVGEQIRQNDPANRCGDRVCQTGYACYKNQYCQKVDTSSLGSGAATVVEIFTLPTETDDIKKELIDKYTQTRDEQIREANSTLEKPNPNNVYNRVFEGACEEGERCVVNEDLYGQSDEEGIRCFYESVQHAVDNRVTSYRLGTEPETYLRQVPCACQNAEGTLRAKCLNLVNITNPTQPPVSGTQTSELPLADDGRVCYYETENDALNSVNQQPAAVQYEYAESVIGDAYLVLPNCNCLDDRSSTGRAACQNQVLDLLGIGNSSNSQSSSTERYCYYQITGREGDDGVSMSNFNETSSLSEIDGRDDIIQMQNCECVDGSGPNVAVQCGQLVSDFIDTQGEESGSGTGGVGN